MQDLELKRDQNPKINRFMEISMRLMKKNQKSLLNQKFTQNPLMADSNQVQQ